MTQGANVLDVDALIRQWWDSLQPGPTWPPKDQFVIDTSAVNFEVLDLVYETPDPIQTPHVIAQATFENGESMALSQVWEETQTSTATFQWSVTAGVKFGGKETVKAKPPVVEADVETSFEINLSVTLQQTSTTTETWRSATTIPIPPYSKVEASLVLNKATYQPHFSALARLSGQVAYHNQDRSIAGSQSIAGILQGHPGVEINGDTVNYSVQGTFKGVQGIGTQVRTKQSNLTVSGGGQAS